MEISTMFSDKLKDIGAVCRIISAKHIPELESEYLSFIHSGNDKQFQKKYINNYIDFSILKKHPEISSIFIIATPSPQVEIKFCFNESEYWLSVPPTYLDRDKVTGNIKTITAQVFESQGYHTFPVILPKKLMAVRSGLAMYGKNNITYVAGMGSYHRLTAFATDLQCEQYSWQEIEVLKRCTICKACLKRCPTQAIEADRFVIDADRCLTYYNEQLEPFPGWIDPKSHNCLIGCMSCQSICPESFKYRNIIKSEVEFSSADTALILKGVPYKEIPEKLQQKITSLDLIHYYKRLSRNLEVLIANKAN